MLNRLTTPMRTSVSARWKSINWSAQDRRLRRFLSIALIAPIFTVVVAVPSAPIASALTTTTTAPQDVTATANGTALNVTWGAPTYGASAVTAYQVDFSTDGSSWTTASNTIAAGTYSYSITGLTIGSSYYVRVAAKMGASASPWAYPWTKLYGTVTPTRNGSNNIVYESGYGLANTTNQAANFYSAASFTRVKYEMQYQSNSGRTFNYVNVDFSKWSATNNIQNTASGTSNYTTPAATISNLAIPDATNVQTPIQAAALDMTVESSLSSLNNHAITGRLEIWANDYSQNRGFTGAADGSTTIYDQNDAPNSQTPMGFGSFQVHDVTNGQTVFAWNRHGSATPDIGIGNSPSSCNSTATTDWTYCGAVAGSNYYNATNRDAWKLEIFINAPTKMVANGLLMRFDAKNSSSYSGSGTTWTDVSGNGITATLTAANQYTTTTSGSTSPANDSINHGSMMFNGSNQQATINSAFNYDFTGGFSASWYGNWGNGAGAYERIFDIGNGPGRAGDNNILVGREGSGSVMFLEVYGPSSSYGYCRTPNNSTDGIDSNWNHWAVVLNGTSCLIYKNGRIVTNFAYVGLPTSNVNHTNSWIGRSNWSGDAYFEGGIADIAFYNRPLQFAEIQNLKEDQAGSTVKASDGTCATRVANPNNVTVTTVANDCVVKFSAPSNTTTSNKWIVPSTVSAARVLAIGGGGGGGAHVGGGGGAGGFIDTSTAVAPSSIVPIRVGAGGSGATQLLSAAVVAPGLGANSLFGSSLVALGGGAGASWTSNSSSAGGSGGGGTASGGTDSSGSSATDSTQGNAGGGSPCTYLYGYPTGGGGGAGGPGGSAICPTYSAGKGGNGGIGKTSDITGTVTYYAGGGGGSGHNSGSYAVFAGTGGQGGGGNGAAFGNGTVVSTCSGVTVTAAQGTDGLGGGGGGASAPWSNSCNSYGGRGGSGVVYVRYGTTTLTISANNGTGYTGATSFTGSTYSYITLPAQSNVNRSGYTFAGWNTSANGNGTSYPASSLFQLLGTQTLYAQWNSTLSYSANGPTISRVIDPTTATGSGPSTTLNNGSVLSNGMVTTGLDLYLDASNSRSYSGSGNTWFDLSGNGRNATAVGSPTYDSANGAFNFNGTSQYFDLGNTGFNYQGTQTYTMATWVKTTNPSKSEQCMICRYTDASPNYGSFLWRLGNGSPTMYRMATWYSSGAAALNSSNYYYLVTSYDGTNANFFINGVRVSSTAAGSLLFQAGVSTYIGATPSSTAPRYFQGQIGAVQVYNIALTDGQVLQNYNALLNKSWEAELPATPGSKAGYTFTGWATSSDTAAAVSSGTYATGLNAVPAPVIRLKATDYDGTNWNPTAYTGAGISYADEVRPTLKTNQTGWGTSATFSSVYGLSGKRMKLGNQEMPSYTFCAMAKWPVNGINLPASSGRMFTGLNVNWLDGWYYATVGDTYHSGWAYDGSFTDYNWHYYCDTGNDIYLDGVKIISTYQSATSLPTLAIGGGYYNGTSWVDYADYEFTEIIIYDKVLSADQLAYVNRYFKNTYGFEYGSSDAPSASLLPSGTFSSPGNSTLYAVWGSTVTYDGNGANSGTAPATQIFQRASGTLATNTGNLSLKGKSFVGWNTKADGTGTFYAAGASYTGPDVTLYAIYKAPVKITNTISGTDPVTLAPYMRFKASDYNATSKVWYDSSGNGRDTNYIKGAPTVVTTTVNQNGSTKSFQTVVGATNATGASPDGVQFKNPTFADSQWTVFSVARLTTSQYSASARLFDNESGNQLFGFYGNNSGVFHSGSWVTANSNTYSQNWVISTAQTDYYKGIGYNGTAITSNTGSSDGTTNTFSGLTINAGGYVGSDYSSGWAVAEVIMFDRKLSASEMQQVQDYLALTYGIQGYVTQNTYLNPAVVNAAANSVTVSETYTAVLGYNNVLTVSPSIPGITFNTSANSASLTIGSTVAVGTYYETITATDFAGNTSSVPIQINVVNPIIWSASNPSTVTTTYGKATRTRLDISGGYGTRVARLSHFTTPAPRGVTIDTSTIAAGYITLISDTGTAPGTYLESITVTDGSKIVRTLLITITVNNPPDITYSAATDAIYPYVTSGLIASVDAGNPTSYSGSGTAWNGLDGTSYNFTLNGNPSYSEIAGGSLYFTGTQNASSNTNLTSALDVFTIEAWFNLKTLSTVDPCFVTSSYVTGNINFAICQKAGAAGTIRAGYYASAAWRAEVTSPANSVVANTWYHVAYTLSKSGSTYTATLYLNGNAISTATSTVAPTIDAGPIRIGKNWSSANNVDGNIPIARVYNMSLSAVQIRQNYANTKPRFLSISSAAPTISGNATLETTEGKASTYQVFSETGGTGNSTFSLSGVNSTFSLASVGTDRTSLIVGSATTATNATTAKTYYETLTATDSTSATTAYYLNITVNPKIAITATTDTVTTTFGKIAYDTITAAYGTGTLQFTRTSSSGSSAITSTVSGNQSVLAIASTLPVGTYYETFTVIDSVSATSIKVIKIVVNPVLSIAVPDGNTLTTTITKSTSRRIYVYDGTDTRTATFNVTSTDSHAGITLDQTNLQISAGGYLTVNVGTSVPANTYTYSVTVRDSLGSSTSISLTIIVNKWPTIQNLGAVSDNIKLSYDASVTGSATNTQWNDQSASSKNMTMTSGALATGESTGLISFNESTTTTSSGSVGNLGSAIDTYSVESWVRISARPTTEACIFCESGGGNRNFYLYIRSTGNIGGNYYNGTWGAQTAEFPSALNTWYHVVFTVFRVGSNYYQDLYINGAKYGSTSAASTLAPATAGASYVIAKSGNATDYAKMSMPMLRLYGRALTASEVQQNYLANLNRFTSAASGSTTIATTAGTSTTSRGFTATNGTGTKTFTRSTSTSGLSISSTGDNTFTLNIDSTLTSIDSQTARIIYETVTATDSTSATSALSFSITVNPAIIETVTTTTITTTSGIESSTVIYATQGTGNKTFTLTGDAPAGVALVSGTNQATLRVLSTINPGTYWETVTATDINGATSSLAIKVIVNPGPTISGPAQVGITELVAGTTSTYSGFNGNGKYAFTLAPTISGITLETRTASTFVIKYTNVLTAINTTTARTIYETVTVTDGFGAVGYFPLTITVNPRVALSGAINISKVYGTSYTGGYTTSGTAPFTYLGNPMCSTEKSTFIGDGSNGTLGVSYTVEKFGAVGSCAWVVPESVTAVSVLTVGGGGGGGGGGWAGGGGAGGVVNAPTYAVSSKQNISVLVGAGGNGGTTDTTCTSGNSPSKGSNGGNSSFNGTFTANGGGGGGGYGWSSRNGCGSGISGGSGGGSGEVDYSPVTATSNQPTYAGATSYGNSGGVTTFLSGIQAGSGGGGAAQAGGSTSSSTRDHVAGKGGDGISLTVTGTSVTYGGGGGGASCDNTCSPAGTGGAAGAGGGGRGQSGANSVTNGTDGLGGGGGGAQSTNGGKGGNGVVIVRYITPTISTLDTITLTTDNSGVVSLNVPEYVKVGTYTQTITAKDSAGGTATATITITISKANPTVILSLPASSSIAKYGTPVTISAAVSTPGSVAFRKSGAALTGCSSVATNNGLATCTWTPSAVETATITAILTPTDSTNYNSSVESASTFLVGVLQADTLTVTAGNLNATYSESAGVADTTIPARTFTLNGLASLAGDSITAVTYNFAGTLNGGAAYSSSATAPKQAGTYTITPATPVFSSGATTNYRSVVYTAGTLTINRAPRGAWSVNYGIANVIRYGAGKQETPTATFNGDGSVIYSTSSAVCSVTTSGTITTLGVGQCSLEVVLQQTNNWLSDTKTVTVTIDRGLRTTTLTPALATIKYGDTTSVTSTISPALDSATVTYSNNNTLGCAVDNVTGQVTGTKALTTCTVRVLYDQTTLYESATATTSITVNKALAPVVTTETITAIAYTGSTALLTPTFRVTGILARDISQILPLADVSTTSAINAIAANSYSAIASYRYFATLPTSYDSTTAPSLGGTYSVTPQTLTLLNGVDLGNYETPTYVATDLVISPIAQSPIKIQLAYMDTITVPYDVTITGGSSSVAPVLSIVSGGSAQGCSVDTAISAMRLKTTSPGTCVIQVTKPADRNYLISISDTQTIQVLNFVVNIMQLFDNPTGIAINQEVPFVTGAIACTVNCQPTITGITDVNGTPMTTLVAGTAFRIVGTNFNTATNVLFTATLNGTRRSAISADSFQIDSDTQITVMPPAIFVPNGTDSVSNIVVRIVVVASGGSSFPNSTIIAISL